MTKRQRVERQIVGHCLAKQNNLPLLRLRGKFENPLCAKIASVATVHPFDFLHVSDAVSKLGVFSADVAELVNIGLERISLEDYIVELENEHVVSVAQEKIAHAKIHQPEDVANLVNDLVNVAVLQKEDPTVENAKRELDKVLEEHLVAHNDGKKIIGTPTGLEKFDALTDGLQKHHIWTISAYTSTGKTTLSMNFLRNFCKEGKRVVFFSLEMSRADLLAKLIALEAGMGIGYVKRAAINNAAFADYKKALGEIEKWNLRIYETKNNLLDILVTMREESLRGVDIFFIDYIQNISGEKTDYEILTDAMRGFQNVMRTIPASLVLVSQISNEDQKTSKPLQVNGKGTGAIRAASDLFLYLINDCSDENLLDYYNTKQDIPQKIIVNKYRHGRIGAISVNRVQEIGQIYEI